MTVAFDDLNTEVEIPDNGTLSRVIHQDDRVRLVIFAFDAGQELSEHRSSSAAIVQVIRGRLHFQAGGEDHELVPGSWLHMEPGEEHALQAIEPTVMLLTLLRRGAATNAPDIAAGPTR